MSLSTQPTTATLATACTACHVFELVPVSADSGETAKMRGGTLLPHEATIGRDYELVITNLGGLYRYRIGDVVRVAGFHGAPGRVQYRIGQLLNLRGEKLSEPQLERALVDPAGALGEYAVAEETSPSRHIISCSWSRRARPTIVRSTKALAQELDSALCEESRVYKTWRIAGHRVRRSAPRSPRRLRVSESDSVERAPLHSSSRCHECCETKSMPRF